MRTMIELRVSGGYTEDWGEGNNLGLLFSAFFLFVIPKVSRPALESNLKAKQNKTKTCALISSQALWLAAWLVTGGCYYGHTGTERADCPFSKKQLIKTNWRLCGLYRIRRLERCSPLLTSASEWPRPLDMRSYGVKSFEIKFAACIIALPACLPSSSNVLGTEMTRDWIRKEGAHPLQQERNS